MASGRTGLVRGFALAGRFHSSLSEFRSGAEQPQGKGTPKALEWRKARCFNKCWMGEYHPHFDTTPDYLDIAASARGVRGTPSRLRDFERLALWTSLCSLRLLQVAKGDSGGQVALPGCGFHDQFSQVFWPFLGRLFWRMVDSPSSSASLRVATAVYRIWHRAWPSMVCEGDPEEGKAATASWSSFAESKFKSLLVCRRQRWGALRQLLSGDRRQWRLCRRLRWLLWMAAPRL